MTHRVLQSAALGGWTISSDPIRVSTISRTPQILPCASRSGVDFFVRERRVPSPIGSPSTRQRDETTKRHLYERSGVSEYWMVDPEIDVVRVYRRTGDGVFDRPIELSREAGDVLTTDLLPGLDLPVTRIVRE